MNIFLVCIPSQYLEQRYLLYVFVFSPVVRIWIKILCDLNRELFPQSVDVENAGGLGLGLSQPLFTNEKSTYHLF